MAAGTIDELAEMRQREGERKTMEAMSTEPAVEAAHDEFLNDATLAVADEWDRATHKVLSSEELHALNDLLTAYFAGKFTEQGSANNKHDDVPPAGHSDEWGLGWTACFDSETLRENNPYGPKDRCYNEWDAGYLAAWPIASKLDAVTQGYKDNKSGNVSINDDGESGLHDENQDIINMLGLDWKAEGEAASRFAALTSA